MSRRRRDRLYAGAVGRATLAQAAAAGRGFVCQPKVDGSLCTALTDSRGRVYQLLTRGGLPFPPAIAADFRGVTWAPDSAVVGELEAWSEASNRVAARRGYRCLHLFDCLRVAGADVSSLPYSQRRDWLMRAESWLVNEDLDKPWTTDRAGLAHDLGTGRYTRPVPLSWRRLPVVPQAPSSSAERSWAAWVDAGEAVEGLVVVALTGKLGARGSKRKVKATETIDAVVVHPGERVCQVRWAGGRFTVTTGGQPLKPGDVVEVRHESFYERTGQPRHARVVRRRPDLEGAEV
jgi:hypothetical protein